VRWGKTKWIMVVEVSSKSHLNFDHGSDSDFSSSFDAVFFGVRGEA